MFALKRLKYFDIFLLLLVFTLPLFFFKLGQSSLGSWDEAWYADIARNILLRKNFLVMWWNGKVFFDHPPVGFWLTSLSYLIFGINNFSARFAQAVCGFLTLGVVYLLGKKLHSPTIGFLSAVSLVSSNWFLYRARSGNLDVSLTLFFVLTFYLAIMSSENKKYLKYFFASLALLFLSKTAVPLTIIPALLIIFVNSKVKLSDVVKFSLVGILPVVVWIGAQVLTSTAFLARYLQIGLPGVKSQTNYHQNFLLVKEYLHSGIGKWFWPGVLGTLLMPISWRKTNLAIAVFIVSFMAPFIMSARGQIWHMVPVYPFMILAFYIGAVNFGQKFIGRKLMTFVLMVFCVYLSFMQIRRNWYEFIDIPAYISDEEILSREAGKYPYRFYIDGDFIPAAAFYSGKNVVQIQNEALKELFSKDEDFSLITTQARLDKYAIPDNEYEIIKIDRDKILVIRDFEKN